MNSLAYVTLPVFDNVSLLSCFEAQHFLARVVGNKSTCSAQAPTRRYVRWTRLQLRDAEKHDESLKDAFVGFLTLVGLHPFEAPAVCYSSRDPNIFSQWTP